MVCLTISPRALACDGTRSLSNYLSGDSVIGSYSVFAFDSSGRLVSTGTSDGTLPVQLILYPAVDYDIYCLANWRGASLDAVSDLDSFLSLDYSVRDAVGYSPGGHERGGFMMLGHERRAFRAGLSSLGMQLERMVSRIDVSSVSMDMEGLYGGGDSEDMLIDGFYMVNCIYSRTIGGEVLCWYNCGFNYDSMWGESEFGSPWYESVGEYEPGSSVLDSWRVMESPAESFETRTGGAVWEIDDASASFYCLANGCTGGPCGAVAPEQTSVFAARPTRLVLSVYSGEEECFYEFPVTICGDDGVMTDNAVYCVEYEIDGYCWEAVRSISSEFGMDWDPGYGYASVYVRSGWASGGSFSERL